MNLKQLLYRILLVSLIIPIGLAAQFKIDFKSKNPLANMSFQKWTVEEGLPTNDVYNILKGKDGFYYLGTGHGFIRFDGAEFKTYNTKNVPLIKANVARNIFADSKNRIWISNGGAGVIIYDNGKFTRLSEDNGLSANYPSMFQEDKNGKIYIGTHGGGINIYDNGKLSHIKKENGLPSNIVPAIYWDSKQRLWIGTNTPDLVFLNNGQIKKIFNLPKKEFTRTTTFYEDTKKNIWIGTDKGILKISNDFFSIDKNLAPLENAHIQRITEDSYNNLWFVTTSGIFVYDNKNLVHLEPEKVFSTKKISDVLINDNSLWMCGSGSGLLRATLNKVEVLSSEHGLSDGEVRAIHQDHFGTFWIGTSKGIAQFDEAAKRMNLLKGIGATLNVYAIESNIKNEIFIGTRFRGLYKFSNSSFTNIADKKVLGVNFIRALFYNIDNTLWIGTNGAGVALYKDGKFRFVNKSSGLKSDFVACITKSKKNNFWIGTSGGGIAEISSEGNVLKTYTDKDGLASNVVNTIYEDDEGVIWISTSVSGISRLKDGKFINISENDGIYSNAIKKMIFDNNGKFWFTTESGLFSIEKKILNEFASGKTSRVAFNLYGKKDGMRSEEFIGISNNSAALSSSGNLFFPSSDGIVLIDPSKLRDTDSPPIVFIDDVFVNYELASKQNETIFPAGTETVQFNYGGISINHARNLTFKYSLDGFDNKWIDVGKRRQAFYTHLPNGKYTFKVIAVSPDGKQSMNTAFLKFTIRPYIWQTYWFRIGFILILLSTSALIIRYNIRKKYKERILKLQAESAIQRERIRISQDMHDELGASLTNISLMTELALRNISNTPKLIDDLHKISNASQNVAITMDEIVWAINPKNDNLDRTISYIVQYAEEFMSNSQINFKTNIERLIPEKHISTDVRHNTFLVVKEALNNIVKHSNATQSNLNIEINGSTMTIKIRDNGKGFDMNKINKFSEGLSNMQKRSEDSKGSFTINSEISKGTEVVIKINI